VRHDGKPLPEDLLIGCVRQVLVVGIIARRRGRTHALPRNRRALGAVALRRRMSDDFEA
jgi:hypothetical protein